MCFRREESSKRWNWSRVSGEQFCCGCASGVQGLFPGTGLPQLTFLRCTFLVPDLSPATHSAFVLLVTSKKPEITTPTLSVIPAGAFWQSTDSV